MLADYAQELKRKLLSLDKDKDMPGFQMAQGGLINKFTKAGQNIGGSINRSFQSYKDKPSNQLFKSNVAPLPGILNKRFIQPPIKFAQKMGEAGALPFTNKLFQQSQDQSLKQSQLYLRRSAELRRAGDIAGANKYLQSAKDITRNSQVQANTRMSGLEQSRKESITSGLETMNVASALANPSASLKMMGVGGVLNSAIEKVSGNKEPGSFVRGVDNASKYAGFVNISNPIIAGVVGKYAPQIGNPLMQNLVSRVGNAIGNLIEDRGLSKIYREDTGFVKDLTSLGIGFILGGHGTEADYKLLKNELTTIGLNKTDSIAFEKMMKAIITKATSNQPGFIKPDEFGSKRNLDLNNLTDQQKESIRKINENASKYFYLDAKNKYENIDTKTIKDFELSMAIKKAQEFDEWYSQKFPDQPFGNASKSRWDRVVKAEKKLNSNKKNINSKVQQEQLKVDENIDLTKPKPGDFGRQDYFDESISDDKLWKMEQEDKARYSNYNQKIAEKILKLTDPAYDRSKISKYKELLDNGADPQELLSAIRKIKGQEQPSIKPDIKSEVKIEQPPHPVENGIKIKPTVSKSIKIEQPKAEPVKTKFASGKTRFLNQDEFRKLGSRDEQIRYLGELDNDLNPILQNIGKKMNEAKISIQDYEKNSDISKESKLVKLVMDKYVKLIQEVDPSFKPIKFKNYVSHFIKGSASEDLFGDIKNGVWMTGEDYKSGTIENHRKNKIKAEDLEQDWNVILKRYKDQALSKVYLKQLLGGNKLKQSVLDYTKTTNEKLEESIEITKSGKTKIKPSRKARDVAIPDFVGIGNKLGTIDQKTDVKLGKYNESAATNNLNFKRIGGKLYEAWQNYRDISTKLEKLDVKKMTPNEYHEAKSRNRILQKKALQDFFEQAGRTEISHPETKSWVNRQIANYVSSRQLERSISEVWFDKVGHMLDRAYLGLSATTAAKQPLELTKLGLYVSKKDIAKSTAQLAKDPVGEAKRLNDLVKLDDFDDVFNMRDFMKTLKSKSGLDKKAGDALDKVLFTPMGGAERMKNVIWASALEQQGLSKGLSGDALVEHIREGLFEQANVASKFNRAEMFDSGFTRLLLKYSQYGFKNIDQIMSAIENNEGWKKAIGLGMAQIGGAIIAAKLTGLTGTYFYKSLVPVGIGPVPSIIEKVFELNDSKLADETKKEKLIRLGTQTIVPAGTQYTRTKEGLSASKGYDVPASGNVKYYGDEATTAQKVKAGFFGRGSLPDVQKYYKDNTRPLGKNQSLTFLNKEGGDRSYVKDVMERRKLQKQINDAKENNTTASGSEGNLVIAGTRIVDKSKLDQIDPIKLTGSESLDKKILSKYRGEITTKENDVVAMYEAGLISEEEATKILDQYLALRNSLKSGSGKKISIKKPKKISTPTIKIAKSNISQSMPTVFKGVKIDQPPNVKLSSSKISKGVGKFTPRKIRGKKIRIKT